MLPCDQHIRGFGKDALYKSTFCITLNYITLIFDLEQLSYMAGHVINPAIKFENTMPICSWVMCGICVYAHTHTYTRLTALSPGLPRWAGTRKEKAIWILLKQETVSGSGISWNICKSAPRSRQITMPTPHHSVFYRPDALPAAQPTASKHWRICSYAYNWKCACGHWASTESRDQWVGGSKTITFFGIRNPYLPIHYKTYMTTIKSHLCSSCPMLKQFSGAYFKVMLKWWFSGKMGV